MFKKLSYFFPQKRFVKRLRGTKIYNVKLTDYQYRCVFEAAKQLDITPHLFMRWCIVGAAKATIGGGNYHKVDVLEK